MVCPRCLPVAACAVLFFGFTPAVMGQEGSARWPAPELTDDSYRKWLEFIRPTEEELKWRQVRWHKSLSEAAAEARKLERPILLWTMNGHPCGET